MSFLDSEFIKQAMEEGGAQGLTQMLDAQVTVALFELKQKYKTFDAMVAEIFATDDPDEQLRRMMMQQITNELVNTLNLPLTNVMNLGFWAEHVERNHVAKIRETRVAKNAARGATESKRPV